MCDSPLAFIFKVIPDIGYGTRLRHYVCASGSRLT